LGIPTIHYIHIVMKKHIVKTQHTINRKGLILHKTKHKKGRKKT